MGKKMIYEVKKVIRDNQEILKFKCPECKIWGQIDNDQYNGRISILCNCGFHETIKLSNKGNKL